MNACNLIIIGPQGSGKTTQAELLAKNFGFALLSAGDVLREIAQEDTELGRTVYQTVNVEGRLVQPELITQVIKGKIAALPTERGLILDGYPRSLTQYELFKTFWPGTGRANYQVVSIELSHDEAVRRLTRRVTCENCSAVYIEGRMDKCAMCGGRLIRRPDDEPEAIQRRLQSFYSETIPMIHAMEADGKVLKIDGAPSVDEVHQKIVAKLAIVRRDF